jgi:hypothetical protein
MYRCYLIRNGRIVRGDYLDAATLEQAVTDARRLMAMHLRCGPFSGMEIWSGTALVYSDTPYGDTTGAPTPIDSPFDTPDTTMLPNWRPTLGRLTSAAAPAGAQDSAEADAARLAAPRRAVRRKAGWGLIAA